MFVVFVVVVVVGVVVVVVVVEVVVVVIYIYNQSNDMVSFNYAGTINTASSLSKCKPTKYHDGGANKGEPCSGMLRVPRLSTVAVLVASTA